MRVLADSSVWIDHLRSAQADFSALLATDHLYGHPLITGEVLMGSLRQRYLVRAQLCALPQLAMPPQEEVLGFVEQHSLFGRGIGYMDVNLLFSCYEAGCQLLTHDKALASAADQLRLRFVVP